MNSYRPWTKEEDAELFANYVKRGEVGGKPNLPGRTKGAICKRAKKLGLTFRYRRNQNPDDYEPDDYQRYMRAQTRRFSEALKASMA